MEDKIVEHLIAYYKDHGIDLHYLLDDGYFSKLPFEKRIELVKQHAAQFRDGIAPLGGKRDVRGLAQAAGFGALSGLGLGLTSALAAKKAFSGGVVSPFVYIVPALAGATYGVVSKALADSKMVKQRLAMRDKFDQLAHDPSDKKAVDVLVSRAIQLGNPGASSYSGSDAFGWGEKLQKMPLEAIQTYGSDITTRFNQDLGNPLAQ